MVVAAPDGGGAVRGATAGGCPAPGAATVGAPAGRGPAGDGTAGRIGAFTPGIVGGTATGFAVAGTADVGAWRPIVGTVAAGRAAGLALAAAALACFSDSAAASAAARSRKCFRTRSACSFSRELECVFFSVMPMSGRYSIKTFALISSSRASSLMRICPDSGIS